MWVGVFRSKLRNRSNASLNDLSGNWWNEEIAAFPSAVFDLGKYFFKKISTTSSQVFKLLPLNECSHLLASSDSENENKLSLIASSGTPAILTVLHISIYVVKCAYGSSLGRPWNKFPWISWIKECACVMLCTCTSGRAILVKNYDTVELE